MQVTNESFPGHEMIEPVEQFVADTQHEVGEGGIAAHVDHQDDGRQAITHHLFELGPLPQIHRGREDDLLLPRVPSQ